jgi:outer membrane protein assembly factor BamB
VAGAVALGASSAYWHGDGVAVGPADASVELPDAAAVAVDDGAPGSVDDGADAPVCFRPGCVAWSLPIRDAASTPYVGRQDGLLLLAEGRHLVAIDTALGAVRWHTPADVGDGHVGIVDLVTTEEEVLLIGRDGLLRSIGLEDGHTRWRQAIPEAHRVTQAAVVDDLVLVMTTERPPAAGQAVRGLAPGSGDVQWHSSLEGRAALTDAGPVVVTGEGTVQALDPADGSVRWEEPATEGADRVVPFHGWVVLPGTETTTVLAADDGTLVATFPAADSIQTPGSVQDALVLVGDDDLSYLDAAGETWTVPLPGPCCRGTALTSATVRLLLTDGRVADLLRDDGSAGATWTPQATADRPDAGHLLGNYLFTGAPPTEDLVVHDVGSGAPIAQLPGTRFPVGLAEDGGLLLVGSRGVAALTPRPDLVPEP